MDREEIKQIAYDFTTSKGDAKKLEERILSLFGVSKPLICGNCLMSDKKCECRSEIDVGIVETYYNEKEKGWCTKLVKK